MTLPTTPTSPSAPCRQRFIVVIGPGRSGTSTITRGLQALGVELGDQLRPGGGKNPLGFFEDEGLLKLNKRVRSALGLRADSVVAHSAAPVANACCADACPRSPRDHPSALWPLSPPGLQDCADTAHAAVLAYGVSGVRPRCAVCYGSAQSPSAWRAPARN